MPDPLLYLQAFVIVASASALVALALGWLGRYRSAALQNVAALAGVVAGHLVGCYWLCLSVRWPPVSALDRYLAIVLPATVLVELVAALPNTPRWLAWVLRCMLAASLGRILLHGSVYLKDWNAWQTIGVLGLCAAILMAVWLLLARLAQRSPGVSLPLAVALTIQGAGVAIMLAGYLKGGAAAMITAAALGGATLAHIRVARTIPLLALLGTGVVSLSSLLIIGVFFGRLPVASALVLGLTLLLCWLPELPPLRNLRTSQRAALRLALVTAIIAVVLLIAKRKFDREFRPLLGATIPRSPAAVAGLPPRISSRSN